MTPLLIIVTIILLQVILLTLLALFIFRFSTVLLSRGMDVPFVPTPGKHHARIIAALEIRVGDVVYDLGSGNGSLLIRCAREYPDTRFIGIERSHLLFFEARLRHRLAGNMKNLTFRRENFFASDFSDATRIYAYLLPRMMERLFAGDAQKGVRVVSRAFEIPHRTPLATIALSERPGAHGQHLIRVYEL